MSYYQNGQYYNSVAARQQQQSGQYARGSDNYDLQEDTNGGGHNPYDYTSATIPARNNSVAARQNSELFIGTSSPIVPPPRGAFYQASSPPSTQSSYNPQLYAQTASQYTPPLYNSPVRPQGTSVPQPYNPAHYSESNLQRHGSTASYAHGFSPGTHGAPLPYQSPSQQSYPVSTPTLYQPGQFMGNRAQSQYGQRPNVQSPSYPSQPGPAPLPPRPSVYSPPAIPSLPTVPGSATSPSEDWGRLPVQYPPSAPASSYHSRQNSLPSPPTHQGHSSRHGSSSRIWIDQSPSPLMEEPEDPFPPTPGPVPPPHSLVRSDTNRHPQERPLPGPPVDSDSEGDYFNQTNGGHYGARTSEQAAQDDLFNQLENAFSNAVSLSPRIQIDQPTVAERRGSQSVWNSLERQNAERANGATTNGHLAPNLGRLGLNEDSDSSDIEAAAGLAAYQADEERERAEEARRQSGGSGLLSSYSTQNQNLYPTSAADAGDSDSDFAGVDMSTYGGGFDVHMSYGGAPEQLITRQSVIYDQDGRSQPVSSSGSMRRSGGTSDMDMSYEHGDSIHPFPPFASNARVDTFGTGGLAEPSALNRRLSYDEGDETGFIDDQPGAPGEPPDMFYHPGISPHRPLPSLPASDSRIPTYPIAQSYVQLPRAPSYPAAPDSYGQAAIAPTGPQVPRSTSMLSHSSTPQIVPPFRSRTDAEERRRQLQLRQSHLFGNDSSNESTANASAVALDLPSLPTSKRFNPSKLTPSDFKLCTEPWALSSIIQWLKSMTEGEQYLKEHGLVDGLVALFTHKVPTMNVADAETLGASVVQDMYKAGILVHEEEWLKFSSETLTGVIYQLSGAGCYAPKLHEHPTSGRCYSHHCQRTLKKIDLQAQPAVRQTDDWQTHYKVKKEDAEKAPKKEIERQNILHEIVQTEDLFMEQLNVLKVLYHDALRDAQPSLIPPKRLKTFLNNVFGKVDAVKKANEDFLLPQLKYRQQEQGPWIIGFSDIFREWIRKAKHAYIEYAAAFPHANFLVRQEAERNILFRSFLDQARNNKLSNKLGWDTYLKAPITRLQRYSLLLNTVLKITTQDSEEKRNLAIAIEEIKNVTLECDARVAEMTRKVDLTDLQDKLKLRSNMQRVELNLDHLGRELILKGDLQRTGANKFTWLETHALLFDHYLVLAKTVTQRDADGGLKYERYDVSRLPIPMDLLVLESTDDDPVMKSSVKGIAAVTTVAKTNTPVSTPGVGRTISSQSPTPGSLAHTNTGSSISSLATNSTTRTITPLDTSKDDKIMYPFRIKHLGKETYTLYAPTAQNRAEWCEKIIEAKTRHAAALFAQNAEPFRLRVMADSAFAYEGTTTGQKTVNIKGTPLDRAIQEVESIFANTGRPGPVCRARVNCATAFTQPNGKQMVAVGTDFGVYVSEIDNPRGWSRAIPISRVTQIAVLEEFSLFLLIADKALIAYHLDVVCPVSGTAPGNDSARKAPQKLSGSRDVGFFATGKMKDRTLVFYKKREGMSSTFKVLEPVFQKSTEKRSRFMRTGRTEFFREYDEFYIPTECMGINLFHSSLAVSTLKGFEVLVLDKKQPWTVPDLKAPHVATIASRLAGQMPLGMFRLSEPEFLLCYEECAVYVNKHGDISRSVIMEFVGKARAAALYGPYVLLFDPDFVEIRNAQNGRLRQVIAGREVKCLDDGLAGGMQGRTIKIALQHPEFERSQIVVELVLNEGLKE